jgi:MYXO-CTERM domain-containing protein
MKMFSMVRLSFLVALLSGAIVSLAAPRSTEACSPALPSIQPLRPAVDETAVPTNTWIWLNGDELTDVKLSDGVTVVTTQLTPLRPGLWTYAAVPATALRANARYTVTARSSNVQETKVFAFTTGAGAELSAPPPARNLRATAERTKGDPCDSSDGYFIDVIAEPSAGAVFYRLERLTSAGEYELVDFEGSPELSSFSATLPSPKYRVRPVAITGLAAADETLPVVQALDESGGCSAAGTGGSSSALWLLMAAVGWGLWQRRRPSSSLHHLARGISVQ